ncbi:hypothetical protein N7523_003278 [Penicillium sp. IBT 18751x]|nr:hypothetical protein N7523_003278 [Penicillium sp. IBT 18751x]
MIAVAVSTTQTASYKIPDYEIRLLVNPSAMLSSKNELTDSIRSVIEIPATVTKLNFRFLDTNSKELFNAG